MKRFNCPNERNKNQFLDFKCTFYYSAVLEVMLASHITMAQDLIRSSDILSALQNFT